MTNTHQQCYIFISVSLSRSLPTSALTMFGFIPRCTKPPTQTTSLCSYLETDVSKFLLSRWHWLLWTFQLRVSTWPGLADNWPALAVEQRGHGLMEGKSATWGNECIHTNPLAWRLRAALIGAQRGQCIVHTACQEHCDTWDGFRYTPVCPLLCLTVTLYWFRKWQGLKELAKMQTGRRWNYWNLNDYF